MAVLATKGEDPGLPLPLSIPFWPFLSFQPVYKIDLPAYLIFGATWVLSVHVYLAIGCF